MAIIPAEEKVFMVSNSTNTTYSGSAALKAMQQWYTMEDVTNTVRPYQVFTALLTQRGGNDGQIISSGPVAEGVTYLIDGADGTDDFSNVGGPAAGTGNGKYFIAINNNIPNNYGKADLIYNNGAPVATILENTLGFNPYFTFTTDGIYYSNNPEWFEFVANVSSVQVFINCGSDPGEYIYSAKANFTYEEGILIITSFSEGTLANDVLSDSDNFLKTSIEVRVYN
jgi:hypothetical protein